MGRTAKKKIAILDEGVLLTDDADSIDFTGAGITGSVINDDVEEEITGEGTPGGATTQVQFNDDGDLAGSEFMTYDKDSGRLRVLGLISQDVNMTNGGGLAYYINDIDEDPIAYLAGWAEGQLKLSISGGDGAIIDINNLTADREFLLPDQPGTFALIEDLVYVSATPPGSPEVNDLWYDIS